MGDSPVETVDSPIGVEITMETDVICRCPFGDGIDRYNVVIWYISEGRSVECQSLQDELDRFADLELSQEQVTDRIGDIFANSLPDTHPRVTVTGEHSGISLECGV